MDFTRGLKIELVFPNDFDKKIYTLEGKGIPARFDRLLKVILLFCCIFISSLSYAQNKWEISDIYIGMPSSTALEKVFGAVNTTWKKPEITSVSLEIRGSKLPTFESGINFNSARQWFLVAFGTTDKEKSKTVAILRNQQYNLSGQIGPNFEILKKSFIDKYGPVQLEQSIDSKLTNGTGEKISDIRMYWFMDVPQKSISLIKSNGIEYQSVSIHIVKAMSLGQYGDLDRVKTELSEINTGTIVAASFLLDSKTGNVLDYTYSLIDYTKVNESILYIFNAGQELNKAARSKEQNLVNEKATKL